MKSRQYKAIAGAVRNHYEDGKDDTRAQLEIEYYLCNALEDLDREKYPHSFSREAFLRDCAPQQKDPN